MKTSTTERDRELKRLMQMRDEEIDTSDIPEVIDWSNAAVGKFYRPIKEPVTIRLDLDVVAWLKAEGPGYQTRINALLRSAMAETMQSLDPVGTNRTHSHTEADREEPEPDCGDFCFPTLEKHRDLDKFRHVAKLIEKRGCVFAPAA